MKRFSTILIAVTALFGAVACQNAKEQLELIDNDPAALVNVELVQAEISVNLGELSKAHILTPEAGAAKVTWDEGDKIALIDMVEKDKIRTFTIVPGSISGSTAKFTGSVAKTSTRYTAAYPFEAVNGYFEGTFSTTINNVQNAGANICDSKAIISVVPSTRYSVSGAFVNKTSLFGIPVASNVSTIYLSSLDGQDMVNGNHIVTFNTGLEAKTYYLSVNPGTYNGLRVIVKTSDGNAYMKESDKTFTVDEGTAVNLGASAMPMTEANRVILISTPSELKSFLSTSTSSTKIPAYLINNIEIPDDFAISGASGYDGDFNGQGYTISNLKSNSPLFVSNSGKIHDLTLDGKCSFNPSSKVFGAIVGTNSGEVSNVVNSGNVSFSSASSVSDALCYGGLVGMNTGTISSCSNYGTISLKVEGDIVGASGLGGVTGYSSTGLSGCDNTGALSLVAKNVSAKAEIGAISSAMPSVGGVVAYTASSAPLANCTNSGKLTFSLTEAAPSANLNRIQIGGIVGSPCGDVTSCINSGEIDVNVAAPVKGTTFNQYEMICNVGGIGGGDWYFTSDNATPYANTSYISCTNEGKITFYSDASKSNSTIGGIVGWPGREKVHSKLIKSCKNSGDIMVEGTVKCRAGGISGGTTNVEACENSGIVTYNSSNLQSSIGGIFGFLSQGHDIIACSNTGDIVSMVANTYGVGGLIGAAGNVANETGAKCNAFCKIQNQDTTPPSHSGMVVGHWNGTSKKIVLGGTTDDTKIKIGGTVNMGLGEIELTGDNYQGYLSGSTNASSTNHVINVYFEGDTPSPYYAEGFVKYSDGSVAQGIAVSNGFKIAITDVTGYYRLGCTADVHYIYYNHPAHVKVTKRSDGTPDFYKAFSTSTTRYDFTLTKMDVEKSFGLVALADPQTHYERRGNQSKADIYRFRDESVPAINAEVAKYSGVNWYGVTLGDLVYSEGGRNSTGGFPTQKENCGKLNFPLFQTMGNHDYYYFSSSNKLTTDATHSTLYLKAQKSFEDTFGPINHSFTRAKTHVICLRDIIYNSATDASNIKAGFTKEQYDWIKADLAQISKDHKIILCVHIPLCSAEGGYVQDVMNLIKQYNKPEIWSAHTHYYKTEKCYGVPEYVHSTVCGQWWWAKIEADGCPNGYKVNFITDNEITDSYMVGVNSNMNDRATCQMRIYKGNLKYGGSYSYFQSPYDAKTYMINIFNGDSEWTVKVYENDVYAGLASKMPVSYDTFNTSKGNTYYPKDGTSQDWWSIGYFIGNMGRGMGTSDAYYVPNYHMWKWVAGSAGNTIKVVAVDRLGNEYTCSSIVTNGTSYPSYIKMP